jgi:predicted metal-dependent hydrolase
MPTNPNPKKPMLLNWIQASLDFFTGNASAEATTTTPNAPREPTPTRAKGRATTPPETPAQPIESKGSRSFSLLRHTDATHSLHLPMRGSDEIEVAYKLERAKRRSIGFVVTDQGLNVKAPQWVGLPDINQALRAKAPWILRKLSELQTRTEQSMHQSIRWEDGATLQFLGEPVTLVLDPTHTATRTNAQWIGPKTPGQAAQLLLSLPHDASVQQIRDAAKAWLMRQASTHFTERLQHFAPQLGVKWTRLSLSNAGTRWGSAKIDGSIRLHWRLIHFKPSVIDYVVVHELSHLRVMNHSPQFWDTVATLVPDYAKQRKQLRTQTLPKWE